MAQIIAVVGLLGSGKSTVAEMISKALPDRLVYQPALADPIKRGAQAMFDIPSDVLYGPSERRSTAIDGLWLKNGKPLTARYVLQTLGTEWGRETLGSDIWVRTLVRYASTLPADAIVIVTDVRFVNEMRVFQEVGGRVWRVRRGRQSWLRRLANQLPFLYMLGDLLGLSPHRSEREQWYHSADAYVDVEIDNSSSLEELEQQVRIWLYILGLLRAER